MKVVQFTGKVVVIIIVSITSVLLAACDGLPLTDQGTSETSAQAEVTPLLPATVQQEETQTEATSPSTSTTGVEGVEEETPTQTIAPDESQEGTLTSPLPTPTGVNVTTVGPEPTQESAASLSPITATVVVTEQVQPTPMPLRQEAPSKSYAEVLKEGEVTVGGYTFSLPQEVPYDRGPTIWIVDWLPNSPDEIIDTRNSQVVAINMFTGQIREFSQQFDVINPRHVKLLQNDQVAFLTYDPQTERSTTLWISGADAQQARNPVRNQVLFPPIITSDGTGLILYDFETKQSETVRQTGGTTSTEKAVLQTLDVLTTTLQKRNDENLPQSNPGYRSTTSFNSRWTVFDNQGHFVLADLNTGQTSDIILEAGLRADVIRWSPDGQKLAMLITKGLPPIPYMKLFVLDITREQFYELDTGFQYVTNVTWAPDNKNLLISVDTGAVLDAQGNIEYETSSLFLINISSKEMHLVPILSEDTAINFSFSLFWAPDGQKIALVAFIPDANSPLYRIDTSKVE